jgi:two-component system, chemotaxis family, CheB/CheR fusion protein
MLDATVRDGFPFPVIGVGASADDVEALQHFFSRTASDTGAAFIVMQPQAPDQETLTAELLARHTRMPVSLMADGVRLEPNHVYVMRPVRRELDSLQHERR